MEKINDSDTNIFNNNGYPGKKENFNKKAFIKIERNKFKWIKRWIYEKNFLLYQVGAIWWLKIILLHLRMEILYMIYMQLFVLYVQALWMENL